MSTVTQPVPDGISIVMPTYNEAGNIAALIRECSAVIERELAPPFYEFIVADDDSPDRTWECAEQLHDPHVRVIRRQSERGLRNSIWQGVQEARGAIIVWMDCDFSHPPRYLPQMVKIVRLGWDIAVNSRYVAGAQDVREGKGTFVQKLLSWVLNIMTWTILGQSFRDYTSGFIAVKADVVKSLGLRGDYGEYFIDFIYRAVHAGYHVLELPYLNEPRHAGESKTGSGLLDYLHRGRKYISTLIAIRRKGGL